MSAVDDLAATAAQIAQTAAKTQTDVNALLAALASGDQAAIQAATATLQGAENQLEATDAAAEAAVAPPAAPAADATVAVDAATTETAEGAETAPDGDADDAAPATS